MENQHPVKSILDDIINNIQNHHNFIDYVN